MWQRERILSKRILNKLPLNSLKDKQEISDNILFFDIFMSQYLFITNDESSLAPLLALCTLEPIELDLFQIFNLFLFCRFHHGIPSTGPTCLHVFHLLVPQMLQLLIFLAVRGLFCVLWIIIRELIWLNQGRHQCFCYIFLMLILFYVFTIFITCTA